MMCLKHMMEACKTSLPNSLSWAQAISLRQANQMLVLYPLCLPIT